MKPACSHLISTACLLLLTGTAHAAIIYTQDAIGANTSVIDLKANLAFAGFDVVSDGAQQGFRVATEQEFLNLLESSGYTMEYPVWGMWPYGFSETSALVDLPGVKNYFNYLSGANYRHEVQMAWVIGAEGYARLMLGDQDLSGQKSSIGYVMPGSEFGNPDVIAGIGSMAPQYGPNAPAPTMPGFLMVRAVPEPGGLGLACAGLVVLACVRGRSRRRA